MVDLVKEIKGKVPNFCGLKFTSTQLDEGILALHANEGKYAVFLGADSVSARNVLNKHPRNITFQVLVGGFALGFDSAIGTTFNIFPNLSVDILNAMNKSKTEEARELQEKLTYSIDVIRKYGNSVNI